MYKAPRFDYNIQKRRHCFYSFAIQRNNQKNLEKLDQ